MDLFKKTTVKNVLTNEQYNYVNHYCVVENLACTILYIKKHDNLYTKEVIEKTIKEYDLKQNVSKNGLDYTANCIEFDLIAYQPINK